MIEERDEREKQYYMFFLHQPHYSSFYITHTILMKKILFVCMAMASSFSFVWGFDLQFPDFQSGDPIQNKFSLVHFTLPNNTANDYQ